MEVANEASKKIPLDWAGEWIPPCPLSWPPGLKWVRGNLGLTVADHSAGTSGYYHMLSPDLSILMYKADTNAKYFFTKVLNMN